MVVPERRATARRAVDPAAAGRHRARPSSAAHCCARAKCSRASSNDGTASPNGVPAFGQPVSPMMTFSPSATLRARWYISSMQSSAYAAGQLSRYG